MTCISWRTPLICLSQPPPILSLSSLLKNPPLPNPNQPAAAPSLFFPTPSIYHAPSSTTTPSHASISLFFPPTCSSILSRSIARPQPSPIHSPPRPAHPAPPAPPSSLSLSDVHLLLKKSNGGLGWEAAAGWDEQDRGPGSWGRRLGTSASGRPAAPEAEAVIAGAAADADTEAMSGGVVRDGDMLQRRSLRCRGVAALSLPRRPTHDDLCFGREPPNPPPLLRI